MVRIAFVLCLLGLLAASPAPAVAHSASGTAWPWSPKSGQRKMAGDFRPVYGTYRNHSHDWPGRRTMPGDFKPNYATYKHGRSRRGLFSFLHVGRRPGSSPSGKAHRSTMTL